jgi:site-specific recombinase XerD
MFRGIKMSQTNPHIDTFLKDIAREEISPKTISSYGIDLMNFSKWFEESLSETFSPTSVTQTDIRDYKSFLITVEHRKPATVNRRLAALKKFFLWAKGRKLIADSPTESVKGVSQAPRAPRSLEKRDIDRLIRMTERHGSKRDLAVISTLRHTGVRVSELCSLTLDDIDISDRKGTLVVRSGKGGKYRVLPLNVDARKAITDYLEVRSETGTSHLFVSQRGEGLKPRGAELLVAKYARLAGLEDVTPHTLRHSFGKHTLDSGANLVAVAALLGHQRLETTAIYTTPSQRDLEKAVDKLVSE